MLKRDWWVGQHSERHIAEKAAVSLPGRIAAFQSVLLLCIEDKNTVVIIVSEYF